MEFLKVKEVTTKRENEVRILELKKETEELAMARAKQSLDGRLLFEKVKSDLKKRTSRQYFPSLTQPSKLRSTLSLRRIRRRQSHPIKSVQCLNMVPIW